MTLFGCHWTDPQRSDELKLVQGFLLNPNYLQECKTSVFVSFSCLSLFFSSPLCRALFLSGLFSGRERKGIFTELRLNQFHSMKFHPPPPPKLCKRMLRAVFLIKKTKQNNSLQLKQKKIKETIKN